MEADPCDDSRAATIVRFYARIVLMKSMAENAQKTLRKEGSQLSNEKLRKEGSQLSSEAVINHRTITAYSLRKKQKTKKKKTCWRLWHHLERA